MPSGHSLVRPTWVLLVLALLPFVVLLGAGAQNPPVTLMVPMRDGVRLATDLYFPQGQGPWPTVLARTPYGRLKFLNLDDQGYVLVVQDWRGYGASEGTKLPFESDGWGDLRDGYDTVEWIANQSWSNGKIGTWGGSALGITQNLMAGSYPPHLVCQHILAGASDLYSQLFFQGGVLRKSMVEGWWAVHGTAEHLAELLTHPNYDWRWDLMNSESRACGMDYPAIHVGGWYDIFLQGTINAFVERQHNGGPGSRGNQKLVMGPWWHGGFNLVDQGGLDYPTNSIYSEIWTDATKLYDFWLKGTDMGWGEIPVVRYYVMGDVEDETAPGNEWRSGEDWPVSHLNLSLYLSENGLDLIPGPESTASYLYDPRNPVETMGGANLVLAGGPMDQRPVEGRDDILIFSTRPLEVPVEVTGRVIVQLYASSSCPDTDFMAKLTDVYPDGRPMLVLDGAIRARHRSSMETEEFMEPGHIYEFWIDLWSTSIVFNKGHRIRLAITSSNYPRFDANPNTGEPFGSSTETRIANNTIQMGGPTPSRVILPLAGPDADGDGVYDLADPFPAEAGPMPSEGEIASLITSLDSRISLLKDPGLRDVLRIASEGGKRRLQDGDIGGAGHLLDIIKAAMAYDPYNITLPKARAIIDSTLSYARSSAAQGAYLDMLECVCVGWKLGKLTEELEGDDAAPVLGKYLEEARVQVYAKGCRDGNRLAEWLGLPEVRMVASGIHLARMGGAPEADLSVIEGILESAKKQYLDHRTEGSASMIMVAQRRIEALEAFIAEPTVGMVLLGLLAAAWTHCANLRRTRMGRELEHLGTAGAILWVLSPGSPTIGYMRLPSIGSRDGDEENAGGHRQGGKGL